MSLPTLIPTNQRFTDDIYMGLPFVSAVPSTRRIDTIFPLAGGGDLSADRSISITMTGGGTLAVSDGRIIAGTSPILINGGPSTTLANDITVSMNAFNGLQNGYVVQNPNGIEGKFYQDNGDWGSSTVSGVPANRTLTMVPPLLIDGVASADLSANRTLDANTVTTTVKGLMPATGGDPTKFFSADLTFKAITAVNAVSLQATTPGTPDIGNADISGVMVASGGYTNSPLIATAGLSNSVTVLAPSHGHGLGIETYNPASKFAGGLNFRRFRGTSTPLVPQPVQNNDWLGVINSEAQSPSGPTSVQNVLGILADGPTGTDVPAATFVRGGSVSTETDAWLTQLGMYIGYGQTSKPTPSALLHVNGTAAITPKSIVSQGAGPTYDYTIVDTDPSFLLIDCSTYATNLTLPTAVGRSGRVYGITKVDETSFRPCNILTTASQSIDSMASFTLFAKGESVLLYSDGFNWWILASHIFSDQWVNSADGTAVANSTLETTLTGSTITSWNGSIGPGATYRAKYAGKLSTTGSPTLRFKIKNSSDIICADSGIMEMPASVTNTAWQISYTAYTRTIGFTDGRVVEALLQVTAADGVMTTFNMLSNFGNPGLGPQPSYVTVQWGTASASNTITCTAAQASLTPRTAVI